ncbi:MAG TPA: hypothetical protein VIM19_04040 [Actinomycetes bacterium]
MATTPLAHADRERLARRGLALIEDRPSDFTLLSVQCTHGHHLATVYRTADGPVYQSTSLGHSHSHGDRDRYDGAHHGDVTPPWVDLLQVAASAAVDDGLPAWCECGARTLSRAQLIQWIADGEHRVNLD